MVDFGEKLDVLCSAVEVHKLFLSVEYLIPKATAISEFFSTVLVLFVCPDCELLNIYSICGILLVGYSWL